MTKEQYLEMCEMMRSEPVESEIPIEYEDLHDEVQEALSVYNMLQDNFDSMNGVYLGKVTAGINDVLEIMGVEDKRTIFFIIGIIDRQRSQVLNKKHKEKAAK